MYYILFTESTRFDTCNEYITHIKNNEHDRTNRDF